MMETIEQTNGRFFTFLTQLKLAYAQAGRPLEEATLGEVAKSLSFAVPCLDSEIAAVFSAAKGLADVPTQKTLQKALGMVRKDPSRFEVRYDPKPSGRDSAQRAFEISEAFRQFEDFCESHGLHDAYLFATEKSGGKWAHPDSLQKLKRRAAELGFRYIPVTLPKPGPTMSYEEYVRRTGDDRISRIITSKGVQYEQ